VKQEELDQFRQVLVALRRRLANNLNHIEQAALHTGGESTNDLSDVPLEHLADRGSENFARDMMIGIMQNSEAEVQDIDTALAKIDAGTFGLCESCQGPIPISRLKALPFARLCIDCRQKHEKHEAAG